MTSPSLGEHGESSCTWREIAAEFLPRSEAIVSLRRAYGGFSDAVVVQIATDSGMNALRGWQPQGFPRERILELHRFLSSLESSCVALPLPLVKSNETLFERHGRYWQLEPWLPGSPCTANELNEVRLGNMMTRLGQIHLAARHYVPTASGRMWFDVRTDICPTVAERRRLIAQWMSTPTSEFDSPLYDAPSDFRNLAFQIVDGFQRMSQQIDTELRGLEHAVVPLQPCWRDLWREHILFVGDEVTGIIDPAAVRTDHVSTDLSRLLGSFFEDDRERWSAALQCYPLTESFSAAEHQLLRVMDRSSVLLSGLTWIERWQQATLSAEVLPHVVERMRAIARRMQALV